MEERVLRAVKLCARDGVDIRLDSDLREDLEFDSVDIIMLVSELEAEFHINIDERYFADMKTVRDIAVKLEEVVS